MSVAISGLHGQTTEKQGTSHPSDVDLSLGTPAGNEGARERGSEGTREQGNEGTSHPSDVDLSLGTAAGNEGARERGSKGAEERGNEGAREQGSRGARERGSKGAREQVATGFGLRSATRRAERSGRPCDPFYTGANKYGEGMGSAKDGLSLDSLALCLHHIGRKGRTRRCPSGAGCVAGRSWLRLLQPDRLD